jgi:hypothetical protein
MESRLRGVSGGFLQRGTRTVFLAMSRDGDPRDGRVPGYAPPMKRLRAFLNRLPGGHRPPTGPLTTSEATDAEESRQETLARDEKRIEREQPDAGGESSSSS